MSRPLPSSIRIPLSLVVCLAGVWPGCLILPDTDVASNVPLSCHFGTTSAPVQMAPVAILAEIVAPRSTKPLDVVSLPALSKYRFCCLLSVFVLSVSFNVTLPSAPLTSLLFLQRGSLLVLLCPIGTNTHRHRLAAFSNIVASGVSRQMTAD